MTVTLDLAKLRPISVPLELNAGLFFECERVWLTMREQESFPLPFPRDV